jgi:3-hydroxybutyryl-CoA dehydratase
VTDPRPLDFSAGFESVPVGAVFATPERVVSEADVALFGALTGDAHPQHLDAAWAARSPFGERIAHGMLVVSLAAGLVPFDPHRVMALRRLSDVVFKRPVRLGERIRVRGRVTGTRPAGEEAGLVELAWTVEDSAGRVACRARVEVLWRRAPFPADPFAASDPVGFVPLPL